MNSTFSSCLVLRLVLLELQDELRLDLDTDIWLSFRWVSISEINYIGDLTRKEIKRELARGQASNI